jgi:hypothetical protein
MMFLATHSGRIATDHSATGASCDRPQHARAGTSRGPACNPRWAMIPGQLEIRSEDLLGILLWPCAEPRLQAVPSSNYPY